MQHRLNLCMKTGQQVHPRTIITFVQQDKIAQIVTGSSSTVKHSMYEEYITASKGKVPAKGKGKQGDGKGAKSGVDYMICTVAEPQKKLPVFKAGKWSLLDDGKIYLYGHDAKTMKQFTLYFDHSEQCDTLDRA